MMNRLFFCASLFMLSGTVLMLTGCGKQTYKEPETVMDPAGSLKKAADGSLVGPDGKKATTPPSAMPGGKMGGKMGMPGGAMPGGAMPGGAGMPGGKM